MSQDNQTHAISLMRRFFEQHEKVCPEEVGKGLQMLNEIESQVRVIKESDNKQSGNYEQKFRIALVGDGGVGKTAFLTRHRTGEFVKQYIPTIGIEIHQLKFHTNYGVYILEVEDLAGQDKFGTMQDVYYRGVKGALLMFDVTSMVSYENVPSWHAKLHAICPEAKVVLCGSKVDCKDRRVSPRDIQYHRQRNLQYYDISARSNYNFDKPFTYLLRKLTGHEDLEFVEEPVVDEPVE